MVPPAPPVTMVFSVIPKNSNKSKQSRLCAQFSKIPLNYERAKTIEVARNMSRNIPLISGGCFGCPFVAFFGIFWLRSGCGKKHI